MVSETLNVSSGVSQLDRLLGGLYIGDNVIWYDDAGSLATVFCLNFMQASQIQKKPLIYVSFDRSPKNLLEKLGTLANNRLLTILDCFTFGKGAGSEIFLKFYKKKKPQWPCSIVKVEEPRNVHQVMDAFYGAHENMKGDVRFVFESLTGMQELWGGEDHIINFYSHSCPRLYELNTIAYWVIEKRAHSQRLRAHINQIAQVVIDLSVQRGKNALTILKAEKRNLDTHNKAYYYWSKDLNITFDFETHVKSRIDLGTRLKEIRTKQGLSQTELAKLVGVTPSSISQVESNLIYPSLPALFKMAEVLSVELNSFFTESANSKKPVIFPAADAVDVKFPDLPKSNIAGKLFTPGNFEHKAEPYILEIPPDKKLPSHFFARRGEEVGYLLSGVLELKLGKRIQTLNTGDLVYLTNETPSQWKNPGPDSARLLWIKVK